MLRQHLKLMLASLILLISTSGCTIGVKEKQIVVYAGFAKTSDELKGAMRIATNQLIPVTIEGQESVFVKKDLGGMIAVRSADLMELIRKANK